jgi:hypothetical protein
MEGVKKIGVVTLESEGSRRGRVISEGEDRA